ncbi:hypothetical protein DRN79_04890 [Methanosarcinales archaeon]|nr:MAG: hypothetical protein DRN79_04890 [Methanosarcinales archaeon]
MPKKFRYSIIIFQFSVESVMCAKESGDEENEENVSEENFCEMLRDLVDDLLRRVSATATEERLELEIEGVDAGVFLSSVVAKEFVRPAKMDDLRENTDMLIEIVVREVDTDLQNRIMVKLQIDEHGDVIIKNHGVQEAEILESYVDSESGGLRAEIRRRIERKSVEVASALRDAIISFLHPSP